MLDVIFKGRVTLDKEQKDEFLRNFQDILNKHNAQFFGECSIFEFDDCEIITDEENND